MRVKHKQPNYDQLIYSWYKKSTVSREEYILIILNALDKFGELSAKEIAAKLKDEECLKKLEISGNKKTKIPSYPTIRRILMFLQKEKNFVKWIPKPTKEMSYNIQREGKMYLAARKCEGDDYAYMLFNPENCQRCDKESIEACWDENFKWLQELMKKKRLGNSSTLESNKKSFIKEIFREPSRLAQVCSYYELRDSFDPFFEKHLRHFVNKINSAV